MAALVKSVHLIRTVNNVAKLFNNLSLSSNINHRLPLHPGISIHTSSKTNGLMEFFEDEKNWGQNNIKVGRSWKKDELRIKSNEDLHKLWFVLLKERNMLMTMEHAYNEEYRLFPNPERVDKIKESMDNLESVVQERNRAYHLLETGETGERPTKLTTNPLGIKFRYKMCEHVIPKFMNTKWNQTHQTRYGGYAVRKFLSLYREKLWNVKRKAKNRDVHRVRILLRKFPNLDIEALKKQYPDVNVDKEIHHPKAQPHSDPR